MKVSLLVLTIVVSVGRKGDYNGTHVEEIRVQIATIPIKKHKSIWLTSLSDSKNYKGISCNCKMDTIIKLSQPPED